MGLNKLKVVLIATSFFIVLNSKLQGLFNNFYIKK